MAASLPTWPTRGERKRPAPASLSDPPEAAAAARQRRRPMVVEATAEEEEEDGLGLAPEVTDVVAALSLLSQRLYAASASDTAAASCGGKKNKKKKEEQARARAGPSPPPPLLPVVLQHQLYTVLDDATAVDVELEALRRQKFVRLLKILTQRQADVAVCLAATYLARLQAAVDQCEALAAAVGNDAVSSSGPSAEREEHDEEGKKQQRKRRQHEAEERVYALRFLMETAGRFTSLSVTRQELESTMAEHTAAHPPPGPGPAKKANHNPRSSSCSTAPSSMVDRALRLLLKLGFLARRVDSRAEEAYWFSAPELGRVTLSLPAGRTAILGALRRSRYKELSERNVQGLDLKGSALSPAFHVADLVGAKEVLAVDTAAGRFLRLPPGAAGAGAGAARSGRR